MRSIAINRFIAALLCLALFVKVVVPVGFMPDMDALSRGAFKITICSGYGLKEIIVSPDLKLAGHSSQHDQSKKKGHDVCPFGATPYATIVPVAFVFALLFFAVFHRFQFFDEKPVAFSSIAAWPRGPPSL